MRTREAEDKAKKFTAAQLPSETLWWLEQNGIRVSLIRFPTAAFSDGVLVAKLLHRRFPLLLDLHAYPKRLNSQQKLDNWETLRSRPLKKIGLRLSNAAIGSLASRCGSSATLSKFLRKLEKKMDAFAEEYAEMERDASTQSAKDAKRFELGTKAQRKRIKDTKPEEHEERKLPAQKERPKTARASGRGERLKDGEGSALRWSKSFSCEEIDGMYASVIGKLRERQRLQLARNAELEAYCEVMDAEIMASRPKGRRFDSKRLPATA